LALRATTNTLVRSTALSLRAETSSELRVRGDFCSSSRARVDPHRPTLLLLPRRGTPAEHVATALVLRPANRLAIRMLTPREGAGAVEQERGDDVMTTSVGRRRLLVVGAHAADFVWRAGGVIAKHTAAGWEATVVAFSYGERGESGELWREEGQTVERVKQIRDAEARAAAEAVGATFVSVRSRRLPARRAGGRGAATNGPYGGARAGDHADAHRRRPV
jgi:hypothetical protein